MAITDKNRKILWGRSGNKCAMCRHTLIFEESTKDSESIVGEECHIVSGTKNGPRFEEEFPKKNLDLPANLILLCRVHHKLIDDQTETYSATILREIKRNHEIWVEKQLSEQNEKKPFGIRRIKSQIPVKLPLISTGKELLSLACQSYGYYHNYSDDLSDEESDSISAFLQNVLDWGEFGSSMEISERMKAEKLIHRELMDLNASGFLVFAKIEKQLMQGGLN